MTHGASLPGVDLGRLRASDGGAGLFGAALVGLLWAPWFRSWQVTIHGESSLQQALSVRFRGASAWQSMAVDDIFLLIGGLLGIWLLVSTVLYSTAAVPLAASAFAGLAGILASILAAIRLIWPPAADIGSSYPTAAAGLGTAAAVGVAVCALASMHSERRSLPGSEQLPVTDLPAPHVRAEGSGA
jgi:hypothetical protein